MLLELLVDAALVLEGGVLLGDGEHGLVELGHASADGPMVGSALGGIPGDLLLGLIVPRVGVVGLGVLVPAGEQTRLGVELVVLVEDVGGVGVVEQVLEVVVGHGALLEVGVQTRLDQVLDDVVVQTAVESDVRAAAQGAVDVCLLCSAGVAGVDDNPLSALLVGLVQPLGADGVVLDGVGADVQDDIGVLHVAPMSSH